MNKLALGTAQFGLDYGINNIRGKIPKEEVFEILNYSYHKGIDFLHTSYGYGNSEAILGDYLKKNNLKFNIISKVEENKIEDSKEIFYLPLKRLNIDKLYGYLINNFNFFLENPSLWNNLKQMKSDGKTEKIGFSLYYPGELDCLLDRNINFDILQIPYSIFDQRFSPYFKELKKKNVKIHVRSVFLQGLVFKSLETLPKNFLKIKPGLETLKHLSNDLSVPLLSIFLNFAILNPFIDKVIIGIDSIDNLKDNVESLKDKEKIKDIYDKLLTLEEKDENIILPVNWK